MDIYIQLLIHYLFVLMFLVFIGIIIYVIFFRKRGSYCAYCGKKIKKNEDYCSKCGKKTKTVVGKKIKKIESYILSPTRKIKEAVENLIKKSMDVKKRGDIMAKSHTAHQVHIKQGGFFESMLNMMGGTLGCCIGIFIIILVFVALLYAGC